MNDWRGPRYSSLSLTTKLALLFSGVVAVAFTIVYFYMVPELRSNLQQQQLADLNASAMEANPEVEDDVGTATDAEMLEAIVRRAAARADARLTVIGSTRSADEELGTLYLVTDSLTSADEAPQEDGATAGEPSGRRRDVGLEDIGVTLAVAGQAFDTGTPRTGLGRENGELTAQVAIPVGAGVDGAPQFVALYSRSLDGVGEAVGFIERRLLVAGVLAVLVALIGGWLVARTLARRVHRLESAAGRLADGDSVEPLPVDSEDELGQLTRAFNEMQAKLRREDGARREFIANASHELRTPIFSLGGFAELLEDEDLDYETRESFIRSMREQIDRLQRLARDLLDLSRLDAGSLEIHAREVDLAELVAAVADEFEPLAARRGATVKIVTAGAVEAWCDPERVAQIVRVLVDNALRHNPAGTFVSIRAARRGDTTELTVADDGRGLDPIAAQRVFDRFYTGDPAGGSGLGLAIARELAERMDGDLALRPRRRGTVFALILPAARDAVLPARASAARQTVGAGRS